jgi:hypothetical protein
MRGIRSLAIQFVSVVICTVIGSASIHAADPSGEQQTASASLRGSITDPSGALVPGALVQLRGASVQQIVRTDGNGKYVFPALPPGAYTVRFVAKGFTVREETLANLTGAMVLDAQLQIQTEDQVLNVEDNAHTVSIDPTSNGGALVLGETELQALSDDPDELQQQLQALAGPSVGPDGGQIYIDGFTGSTLPTKSSIREVRINSNPFSTEFDRPGFGRIEIFTKPGKDSFHGSLFGQFNDQYLNSRSPLLTQSTRPPYDQKFFGASFSGPLRKDKASFSFDFERRMISENAFIDATILDSNLNPQTVNQAVVTPQTRTSFTPRLDYTINSSNTLTLRYQDTRIGMDKEGVGSFSLASQAYNQSDHEQSLQLTETAVLNTHTINESRFQFMRSALADSGSGSTPTLNVQGAFLDGSAQVGDSSSTTNRIELSNMTTLTHGAHTFKWGARLRQSFIDDTSLNNFNGTFTFFGDTGPELDSNNQPIAGTSEPLTALEVYRRTLLFEGEGLPAALIRQYGGGASQFTLNAGTPETSVRQFDVGMFINDDWRMRSNLTLSYGLRYETQTNIHDLTDFAPRAGLAWGIGGGANKQTKTVLRLGAGVFYDRIADSLALSVARYNGLTQQSYFIQNPDFYPNIPSAASLSSAAQPQQLQLVDPSARAPRNYQGSLSLERQVNKYVKLTSAYIESRGVHLSRQLNANTPLDGVYPYGETEVRLLTETTGFSRTHQLVVSPNINYKKLFLFGFYSYSHGQTDAEGMPANPYDLKAEWGPSSFADVRHRFLMGTNIPMPLKFSLSPFLLAMSGSPYNITTGLDPLLTGYPEERPALLMGVSQAGCTGANLVYESQFGCFNLNPAPGTPTIGRDFARGPSNVTLNLRVSRSWSFGKKSESTLGDFGGGPPPGIGGVRGGGGPPPGGGPSGGGGPPGGGPPPGMFGGGAGNKYSLTFSASFRNILNHPNYGTPNGDLSSPFFGESLSLAGFGPMGAATTYNRKVDLQLRFTF